MILEHLEIDVQGIVANVRTEIDELTKGTTEIIGDIRKDLEQGRTIVLELLKTIDSFRSTSSTTSPLISTSPAKPATSLTIQSTTSASAEPSLSSSFLEKEKEMLEFKATLLSKRTIQSSIQTK